MNSIRKIEQAAVILLVPVFILSSIDVASVKARADLLEFAFRNRRGKF